jgi:hypothetical protein
MSDSFNVSRSCKVVKLLILPTELILDGEGGAVEPVILEDTDGGDRPFSRFFFSSMRPALQTEEQRRLVFKDSVSLIRANYLFFYCSIVFHLRYECGVVLSLHDLLLHALTASLHSETHQTQASRLHPRLLRIHRTTKSMNMWR